MLQRNARTQGYFKAGVDDAGKRKSALVATVFGGIVALMAVAASGYGALLTVAAGLMLAAGFAIAAIAWVTNADQHEAKTTSWDVAGVLVLLACAAAIIAD